MENIHDFQAGFGVQIAGGLVGEDQRGPCDEGNGRSVPPVWLRKA